MSGEHCPWSPRTPHSQYHSQRATAPTPRDQWYAFLQRAPYARATVPRAALPHRAPPLAVPPARALILAASAAPGVVRVRACVAACAVRSWTGASSPQTARKLAQRRSMHPPRLGAAPRSNGPEQWVTAIVVLRARQTRDVHSRKGMKQRKRERKEKKRKKKKKKGKKDGDAPGMTCWKQVDVGQRSSRRRRRHRVQSSKSVEEDEEEFDESFEDGDVDKEEPT
ncbi:hypothetical protein B0H14DRAFT_2608302 [Mycena olivaceomarginata]|nr:hypothetical protein B0H14DRAFT_2608302 [Mycena olivaceomarginata]